MMRLSCFSCLLQHPLTMVMLFTSNLNSLLNFLSFARWLFIGLAVTGMIYLRYKRPDMPRPFKVSLIMWLINMKYISPVFTPPLFPAPNLYGRRGPYGLMENLCFGNICPLANV